jgi:hypothetical protein
VLTTWDYLASLSRPRELPAEARVWHLETAVEPHGWALKLVVVLPTDVSVGPQAGARCWRWA